MSTYRLLAAAAVLSAITGPAMAQHVVYEPGFCAFYYPNANCQNNGPGNPFSDPVYKQRLTQGGSMHGSDQTVGVVRKRTRTSPARVQ